MAYTKTNWANGGTPPISAANLNNIENGIYNCDNAINHLATYSTTETPIGTWIDGKIIYRKVINFGALPNASSKQVSSGLTMANVRILNLYGTAVASNKTTFPVNTCRPTSAAYAIGAYCNAEGNVCIDTGVDRTDFTAYIVLEYIKLS